MKLNKKEVINLIQASLNCYKDSAWFKEKGLKFKKVFDRVEDITVDTVQCYLGFLDKYPDRVYVICRGSEEDEKDNADWKTNFKFSQRILRNFKIWQRTPITKKYQTKIKVHRGFLAYLKKIKSVVLEKVFPFKEVVFAGHSLGAAVSSLAAESVAFNYPDKDIACAPFSSPRVGNGYWTEAYNQKVKDSYRVWYGQDTCVRLPPWLFGYRHVDTNYHIWKNMFLPWNWITQITSMPLDHWPQLLLEKAKKYLKIP